jgi:hypothetical protein
MEITPAQRHAPLIVKKQTPEDLLQTHIKNGTSDSIKIALHIAEKVASPDTKLLDMLQTLSTLQSEKNIPFEKQVAYKQQLLNYIRLKN